MNGNSKLKTSNTCPMIQRTSILSLKEPLSAGFSETHPKVKFRRYKLHPEKNRVWMCF